MKDQNGYFQYFQVGEKNHNSRDGYTKKPVDRTKLYGLSPEHKDSPKPPEKDQTPYSLSTRYAPDMPGVQARRISDGVYANPFTNKVYNYNEGFKTDDGRIYAPGTVDMQTDLVQIANRLDELGLIKEANVIDEILVKISAKIK